MVAVRAFRGDTLLAWGSAVLLGDGGAITAAHVVEGADRVEIEDASGGREVASRFARPSPRLDLALLEGVGREARPLARADPLPHGSPIYAVGRKSGIVATAIEASALGAPLFAFRGGEAGDSGGAVVDPEGRLVGVIVLWGDLGFAVPISCLDAPPESFPDHAEGFEANLLWGVSASREGDWKRAVAFLTAATAARPLDPLARFELGHALLEGGDAEGAARSFERVVELTPNDARAWYDLGLARLRGDRPEVAVEAFDCAVRLAPGREDYRRGLDAARAAR